MKLFMLFCFAVFFFTGCNKASSGKARGPEGDAAKKAAAQAKQVPQPIADEIAMAFEIFREMNGTHQQMVELITDTKGQEQPKNIFQILYVRLSEEYLATGQGRELDPKKKACSTGKSQMRHKEVMLNNRKTNQYFLYFDSCKATTPKNPLAMWVFEDTGKIKMRFNVKALLNEPNRVYGSSAVSFFAQEGKKSECSVSYDTKEKHIESYHCENMSHDFKAKNESKITKEIFFDQVDYVRSQQKPLVAKGFFLDHSVYPATKTKVIAEDDPSLNQFKVAVYPEPTEKSADGDKKPDDDIFNTSPPENGSRDTAPPVVPAPSPTPGAPATATTPAGEPKDSGAKKLPNGEVPTSEGDPAPDGFSENPLDGGGVGVTAPQAPAPITGATKIQNSRVS